MSNRSHHMALVVSMMCLPLLTTAGTAEEIARLNEATALQAAQLAELEMRAKVLSKQFEIDRASLGAARSSMMGGPPMATTSGLPTVRAIEGADGNLTALLVRDNGAPVRVSKGSTVGKWTVVNIEGDTVTLSRKGDGRKKEEVVKIAFSSEAATATPAALPSLPPVPQAPYSSR